MKLARLLASFIHAARQLRRSQPYRGALVNEKEAYLERRLIAGLWGGVALLAYLVCRQAYDLCLNNEKAYPFITQKSPLHKPDIPALNTTAPSDVLPAMQEIKIGRGPSLFHIRQATPSQPSLEGSQHPREEKHRSKIGPQKTNTHSRVWQLEVKRLSEANMAYQLADARDQLQAGRFELARQSFEQVLEQDPHQVVALAGMLVVISQRGDISQRENYLRRLRREIPDFMPDDDLFLLQVAD
jgi:tetratricopeptide (TPR) repeat protein